MYTTFVQMPDVDWSTVPGPRSKGFIYKKDTEKKTAKEQALETHASLVKQIVASGLRGLYVITTEGEKEILRSEVSPLFVFQVEGVDVQV